MPVYIRAPYWRRLTAELRGFFNLDEHIASLTPSSETDPIVGAVNGIVKADGAGNISAAIQGTDYLAPVTFGNYMYFAQNTSADTIGDWRVFGNLTAFYVEYCTVANATKGGGTWVMKQTIQI